MHGRATNGNVTLGSVPAVNAGVLPRMMQRARGLSQRTSTSARDTKPRSGHVRSGRNQEPEKPNSETNVRATAHPMQTVRAILNVTRGAVQTAKGKFRAASREAAETSQLKITATTRRGNLVTHRYDLVSS